MSSEHKKEQNVDPEISVIIPAKNESAGISKLLPELKKVCPDSEIIVVDDGSTDNTAEICLRHGVRLVQHPYSMGNGAAVKTGAREAKGNTLVFMDGDGQHDPEDIPRLLKKMEEGFAMVVGSRTASSQATLGRRFANNLYNRLASWMVEKKISDLTSGFRVASASKFRQFLYMLPNGFSYPTTITMTFFRAGYPVAYLPIYARRREGTSHIHPLKDGVRFMLIIFKIGTLYSPLKLFVPISLTFLSIGLLYALLTLTVFGRFTNMSALLISTSTLVFLIGLVSEQITSLIYSKSN